MIVFAKTTLHLPGNRTIPAGGAVDTDDAVYAGRESSFETAEELHARTTGAVVHNLRPLRDRTEAAPPAKGPGRRARRHRGGSAETAPTFPPDSPPDPEPAEATADTAPTFPPDSPPDPEPAEATADTAPTFPPDSPPDPEPAKATKARRASKR